MLCVGRRWYSKRIRFGRPCHTVAGAGLGAAVNMYKLGDSNMGECVQLAAQHIQLGNVIAVPTDTIYGLAANAQDREAILKLYKIKGREFTKPLSICVSSVDQIRTYAQVEHLVAGDRGTVLGDLLPGPVTVLLDRTERLNADLNPSTSKVGVRIPEHEFVRRLTARLSAPIALTSANKSNEASSTRVDEFSLLWNRVDAVFDGGATGDNRSGSTIIDLSQPGKYEIVREGCYLKESLEILSRYYR